MSFGDFFGFFASKPAPKSVSETVREAAIKRRKYERQLQRERQKRVDEMARVEEDLRKASSENDKKRGIPLLRRFKTLEMMIQRIDNVIDTSDMSSARLDMANTTDLGMHVTRINSNAMHRINDLMSSDQMRAPMERLANEVSQFDATDAEIQAQGNDLMASLGASIEEEDITEGKWEEWVAMHAQRMDVALPDAPKPDPLQLAIDEAIASAARPGQKITE